MDLLQSSRLYWRQWWAAAAILESYREAALQPSEPGLSPVTVIVVVLSGYSRSTRCVSAPCGISLYSIRNVRVAEDWGLQKMPEVTLVGHG